MHWRLAAQFERHTYSPLDNAAINVSFVNNGFTPIRITDAIIRLDFGSLSLPEFVVTPMTNASLGRYEIRIPQNVVGCRCFDVRFRIQEIYTRDYSIDHGFQQSSTSFISVYPRPWYRVFISRSISSQDRKVGDVISSMISEWGFETATVGIEVKVSNAEVPDCVKDEISKANAVIAILTPRTRDAVTNLWRTLEWAQSEIGVAFGINKPLLILKDRRVELGGLPSFLVQYGQALSLEYDDYNLNYLRYNLALLMPTFRAWIEGQNFQQFVELLKKLAIGGSALIGGIEVIRRLTAWIESE
jgi:hypothetical protein